jgi:hypothetical protein
MSTIQTQPPESVNAATSPAGPDQPALPSVIASARAAVQQKITGALTPGWVILALGTTGYLLSETKIFGPLLAILLAIATIYQLNQYVQKKGGKLLG